jgi:hypothetical protein
VRSDDLFLPGEQRDVADTLLRHRAVVVLTREQAQREADDAGGMRQQPFDGEVRLAGVGRAEDGFDARGESGHCRGHEAGWLVVAGRIASGWDGWLTVRSWSGRYRWAALGYNHAADCLPRKSVWRFVT